MSGCVVGLVTCGSRAEARKVVGALLRAKAAACVNISQPVESHYWWRGKRERSRECLLLIKTTRQRTKEVERVVKETHSYEVPEIIFLPVVAGERRYLKWVKTSVAALAIGLYSVSARADRIDDLVKQLGHADPELRAEAAEKLATIGGERVEQQFREMLKSSSPERRQMATVGLLQVSDVDADAASVRERLQDEDSTVRWSAAMALGDAGRIEALPALQEAAQSDKSESVREAATEAVARLQAGIPWRTSLAEGYRQAKASGKPVLAYFAVRGSEFCERFEQGVLADKAVVDAAQEFVPVRLDAGRHGEEARRLDVRGAPTVLILDAAGNEMARVAGLVDVPTLLERLGEARRSKLTFREARRLALQDPANVPANWKVAQTYLEDGREDLAEPHLRNVIAHDEANEAGFTDNALFALGFTLGRRGEYGPAVYCLEELLKRWPAFKDKDKALYCLGLSRLAIGQKAGGRAALDELVRDFPDSSAVAGARKALEKLGAGGAGDEKN